MKTAKSQFSKFNAGALICLKQLSSSKYNGGFHTAIVLQYIENNIDSKKDRVRLLWGNGIIEEFCFHAMKDLFEAL